MSKFKNYWMNCLANLFFDYTYIKNISITNTTKRDIALDNLRYSFQTLVVFITFLLGMLSTLFVSKAKLDLDSRLLTEFLIFSLAFLFLIIYIRCRAINNLFTIERMILESAKETDIEKNTTCRCVKIKFHETDHGSVSGSASSTARESGLVINLCLTQARGSDVSTLANVSIEARS